MLSFSRSGGLEQNLISMSPTPTYWPVAYEAPSLALPVSTCVRDVAAGHILGDETDVLRGISPCFKLPGKSSTLTLHICRSPKLDYSSTGQLFFAAGGTKRMETLLLSVDRILSPVRRVHLGVWT